MSTNPIPPPSGLKPEPDRTHWFLRAVGRGLAIGLPLLVVVAVATSVIWPATPSPSGDETPPVSQALAAAPTLPERAPAAATAESTAGSTSATPALLDAEAVERLTNDARSLLAQLPVTESLLVGAPVRYDRDDYDGQGWADDDGDCLGARHEVLLAESETSASVENCRVSAGRWTDWMTGETLQSPEEATVDHVVPLGHAHRAGAWQWNSATKRAFANDLVEPSTLNIAGALSNQSKGAAAPDEWRPEEQAAWCGYAVSWIRVKARWGLATSTSETAALDEMLSSCEGPITLGVGRDFVTTPVISAAIVMNPATGSTATPTEPAVAMPGPPVAEPSGSFSIVGCDRRAESVTIINGSTETLSLLGWRLHDQGANHTFTFELTSLANGETVSVLTGDAYVTSSASGTGGGSDLLWKSETIWNNGGDTAYLLDPSDTLVSQRSC